MAEPWTLAEAQTHLAAWLAAELAIAEGAQSYTVGSRSLTRADLPKIADRITFWRRECSRLTAGRTTGPRARRFIPRDL
ncbi:MAG: DUF6148 family protein [Planctomycetota bacterium]|nr:DUF6148 family protein [Planctomycetota bacterium]